MTARRETEKDTTDRALAARPPDIMADDRVFLAWQRSHMANERTFLAWCKRASPCLPSDL